MRDHSAFRSGMCPALLAVVLAWSGWAASASAQTQEKPADQAASQQSAAPQTSPGDEAKGSAQKPPARISDVSKPVAIYKPEPPYSEEARQAKWQGTVVLFIEVDAQGNVSNVRVVRPLGRGLDEEAVNTVKTWKFTPAMLDGKPIAVRVAVEVNFRLPSGPPDYGVSLTAGKDSIPPQPISTPDPESMKQTLTAYFIDVEGGQATLFVSPSGESMLVDTGWPDFAGRDADRIVAAAKLAGVKRIDYLVVTHYHADHVGGVPQLAQRIPIANFVDHGPHDVETDPMAQVLYKSYETIASKSNRILARPGEKVPITGIDVEILTAAGEEITQPLAGAGEPNPLCATTPRREVDTGENAQSVGMMITYGKFRMVDLGDLTWNKELDLVCPNNKLGTVDVYLSTHHGMNLSGSAAVVPALHPRVAIMNNGARKGGTPEAWQAIHSSPDLKGFWQLHYAEDGGPANNVVVDFIANQDAVDGNWIRLSADADGGFTVTNGRNGRRETYPAGK